MLPLCSIMISITLQCTLHYDLHYCWPIPCIKRIWEGFPLLHVLQWLYSSIVVYRLCSSLDTRPLMVASGLLLLPYMPFAFCASPLQLDFFLTQTFSCISILISTSHCRLPHIFGRFDFLVPLKIELVLQMVFVSPSLCTMVMLSSESSMKSTDFGTHGSSILTMWPAQPSSIWSRLTPCWICLFS